jgi:hypothetical protein
MPMSRRCGGTLEIDLPASSMSGGTEQEDELSRAYVEIDVRHCVNASAEALADVAQPEHRGVHLRMISRSQVVLILSGCLK